MINPRAESGPMRNLRVEVERDRIRLRIAWEEGEDEFVTRLTLEEAEDLASDLEDALEDYDQRKRTRID